MVDIETRLTNVENMLRALIVRTNKDKQYQGYSDDALTKANYDQNSNISENDLAICDIADLSDINSGAIDDLAEIIDDLSNRVSEMEEHING